MDAVTVRSQVFRSQHLLQDCAHHQVLCWGSRSSSKPRFPWLVVFGQTKVSKYLDSGMEA